MRRKTLASLSSRPADGDDFLAWVQGQRERYELVGGQMVTRAGGSEDHDDIQVNLLAALKRRLRGGPCKPNGSDLLVRIDERTGRFPEILSPRDRAAGPDRGAR